MKKPSEYLLSTQGCNRHNLTTLWTMRGEEQSRYRCKREDVPLGGPAVMFAFPCKWRLRLPFERATLLSSVGLLLFVVYWHCVRRERRSVSLPAGKTRRLTCINAFKSGPASKTSCWGTFCCRCHDALPLCARVACFPVLCLIQCAGEAESAQVACSSSRQRPRYILHTQ